MEGGREGGRRKGRREDGWVYMCVGAHTCMCVGACAFVCAFARAGNACSASSNATLCISASFCSAPTCDAVLAFSSRDRSSSTSASF